MNRPQPQFQIIRCVNCNGYGAKGLNPRIVCPSCEGEGILKIPLENNQLKYSVIACKNCSGYGTKGYRKLTCPTCKRTGIIQIQLTDKSRMEAYGK